MQCHSPVNTNYRGCPFGLLIVSRAKNRFIMANGHSCRINSGLLLLLLLAHAGRHAEDTIYFAHHLKFLLLRFCYISFSFYSLTSSPSLCLSYSISHVRRHKTEAPARTLTIVLKQRRSLRDAICCFLFKAWTIICFFVPHS